LDKSLRVREPLNRIVEIVHYVNIKNGISSLDRKHWKLRMAYTVKHLISFEEYLNTRLRFALIIFRLYFNNKVATFIFCFVL